MSKRFLEYILFLLVIFVAGCATVGEYPSDTITGLPEPEKKGVYHKVKRGETIWRIATTYDVAINDIINVNNIPNAAKIEENQLVFIPGADSIKEIKIDAKDNNEFVWPVKGKVISYFHQREGSEINKGIEIEVKDGDTIKASRSGNVVFSDFLPGYGNTIVLDHMDGFYSIYSNNSNLIVKTGEYVSKYKEISTVGKGSKGSSLHFEIRKNAIEENPLYYLP